MSSCFICETCHTKIKIIPTGPSFTHRTRDAGEPLPVPSRRRPPGSGRLADVAGNPPGRVEAHRLRTHQRCEVVLDALQLGLRETLLAAIRHHGPAIRVDLEAVTFIDCSGSTCSSRRRAERASKAVGCT